MELAIEADVNISDSANYDFRMEAQENILEVIETKQDGDRLIIKLENGKILGKHEPIRIWIKAPNVDNLHISGSGNIIGESSWSADECKMSISGSGSITRY
ncbi:MAG: hypothetical protein FJY10_07565 [Bacteroidetes bacterium]|nr:hypothetical protein [Bacteroidota bacterium]